MEIARGNHLNLTEEIMERTQATPRVLWIELTSRCPFDCVFCTRKTLRGAGQHMDFSLFESLVAELVEPSIIRLNYSGESGHYPRLADAIALAAQTGAQVELVSAMASLKAARIEAMLRAGLNRLTLSLHTLDAARFEAIYRYSSLASFMQGLDLVQALAPTLRHPFQLDLAFVAMDNNLDELPAIAEFAVARGIQTLAVHPLIGRDLLPAAGRHELDSQGRLQIHFANRLVNAIAHARKRCAALTIQVSTPELEPPKVQRLRERARASPGDLPVGAEISGCDQSPFETMHVLADGTVVACEVTDKMVLGDLRKQSLAGIWHGAPYQTFRLRHRCGEEPACRTCNYKHVALPQFSHRMDNNFRPALQLLQGFFNDDDDTAMWTRRSARFWLQRRMGDRKLMLRGMLPPPPHGESNILTVQIQTSHSPHTAPTQKNTLLDLQSSAVFHAENKSTRMAPVKLSLPLNVPPSSAILVDIQISHPYCPFARGEGSDLRQLGFALLEARCTRL
jgi:radical SAM protein with 4Fe4S-binding SPASM domain